MQEQVNEKAVALSTRGVKMTAHMLEKMIRTYLQHRKNIKNKNHYKPLKEGKQSLNSLKKHGASLADVEISGDNIGSFNRIARKYKLDFAMKKDASVQPPNWVVFFKAKDSQSLDAAFKEYTKVTLQQKAKKPSLLNRIAKIKDYLKSRSAPVKNKDRGGHEL